MKKISVLYGSETGNAEDCARELRDALRKDGYPVRLCDMFTYKVDELPAEHLVLIICSTFGQGDAPSNAEPFHQHLTNGSPKLPGLRFGVCALGDRSFEHFAQAGRDMDRLLGEAGGERVIARVDCDAEYEVPFNQFKQSVFRYLEENEALYPRAESSEDDEKKSSGGFFGFLSKIFGKGAQSEPVVADGPVLSTPPPSHTPGSHRDAPYPARFIEGHLLSGANSKKETRHYTLDLSESQITYQTGDCVGIYPENSPAEVDEVIQLLGYDTEETLSFHGMTGSLREVLLKKACLQKVTVKLLERVSPFNPAAQNAMTASGAELEAYIHDRHVIDVLREATGCQLSSSDFLDCLRSLQPRLYTIASSASKSPRKVDLLVETIRFERHGRQVQGAASAWLAAVCQPGSPVPLYLHPAEHFRLAEDQQPIIMIGPGTGIAPFRAFLQERELRATKAENWLFFGHQHETEDFLYRDELLNWKSQGLLQNLSCAWSRDQKDKVYVQDKLQEAAQDIWRLINSNAVIYVCGDAHQMAPAVHEVLANIFAAQGQVDGHAYLEKLEQQGRYRRDVY
ncbi:MAG: sulfite reductase flavoprotein subunit alpha [Polyangiaceae bacterium]|nr:sulfite reductase flavoprotein subunit alpha [Polyangiaceae bacterium]